MLSLLRWGLGSGHEHHLTDKVCTQKEGSQERPHTAMNPSKVKRKRGQSTQSIPRPPKKDPKLGSGSNAAATKREHEPEPEAEPSPNDQEAETSDDEVEHESMDLDRVTGVLDAEQDEAIAVGERNERSLGSIRSWFNLQILLKHDELRLIDQEIGKVQIALEQLRRCSVIPYPSTTAQTAEDVLNVSDAKGIPAPTEPGKIPATHPPPWGVVDGPYSRHYARWLLPDPAFDGGQPEPPRVVSKAGKSVPERHTRGGKELSLPMTKPRPRAGLSRYQAIGNSNGEHKDTKGPMILKRALDGKLVKLVCINCHREDFNSAQGFINHCRIAHGHNLASHEAAARECGQEIDPNEVIETVPETSTPVTGQQAPVTVGLVHPLNKPQMPPVPKLSIPRPKRTAQTIKSVPTVAVPSQSTGGSFKPSTQLPHLSRLFERLGQSVDLTAAVQDATTKDEAQEDSEDEALHEDTDSDEESTPTPTATGMARVPSRSTRGGPSLSSGSNRPKSQKGPERAARRPYDGQAKSTQITLPDRGDILDLSPNTITSVNAPSLISDTDNASSDEEYTSNDHPESSSAEHESDEDAALDEEDIDVDMTGESHLRGGFGSDHAGSSVADPELRASSKARSHHTNSRNERHEIKDNDTKRRRGKGRRKAA